MTVRNLDELANEREDQRLRFYDQVGELFRSNRRFGWECFAGAVVLLVVRVVLVLLVMTFS